MSGTKYWSSGSIPLIEPEFLSSIISAASDIALVVSANGIIRSVLVNSSDASYGKLDHWEGRPIVDFLTVESVPKMARALEDFRKGGVPVRAIELTHSDNAVWEFPIRYTFHALSHENAMLMLGRDLRQIAETQQQLVRAQMSLEQGYEARREFDARYRLLLRSVSDAIIFVSVADGRIRDLNEPAAAILGGTREEMVNVPLSQEFRDRRREELVESLINSAMSDSATGVVLQTRRGRQQISIVPQVFRASGERILICRLLSDSDTRAVANVLDANLMALFERGSDAVVFTSINGIITACNDSFLDLVNSAHTSDVKGRNMADYLARGQIDMGVVTDNARRSGTMRIYSTKIQNDLGGLNPVEMSVAYLNERTDPELGFVIRDASRVDALRKPNNDGNEDSNRSVMELVGSATLKEIVADTTDVVEKMCIETAVSLTRNNRVAAAEMLGLSRQSLYVKLRKYGLLSKNADTSE